MDVGEVVGVLFDERDIGEIHGGVVHGRVYLFGKMADVEESVGILVDKQDGSVFPGRVGGFHKNEDVEE